MTMKVSGKSFDAWLIEQILILQEIFISQYEKVLSTNFWQKKYLGHFGQRGCDECIK